MSDTETIGDDVIEQEVELQAEKKEKRKKAPAASPAVTSPTEKARAIVRAKLAAR